MAKKSKVTPLRRGNLILLFWMQFDLTQKLELNYKQEDCGHTDFTVTSVTTGRVASSNKTIVGVKPLHMSLKWKRLMRKTLIWKEPMSRDHPPFNFDAFSTHQPCLSHSLCQPKKEKKKRKKKGVMRNEVTTFQTSKGCVTLWPCHLH